VRFVRDNPKPAFRKSTCAHQHGMHCALSAPHYTFQYSDLDEAQIESSTLREDAHACGLIGSYHPFKKSPAAVVIPELQKWVWPTVEFETHAIARTRVYPAFKSFVGEK
jgi:hypothetical protein